MSAHFSRLNLDRPADLDHVITAVNQHAHKVAQMEFGSELERDKALKAAVDKVIKRVSLSFQCHDRMTRTLSTSLYMLTLLSVMLSLVP